MSCFPCFSNKKDCFNSFKKEDLPSAHPITSPPARVPNEKRTPSADANNVAETFEAEDGNSTVKTFTFRELATATKNFRQECLLGEDCFGRVFRGTLQSSGQVVTVRQLDKSGTQGSKEFQVEVLTLSLLKHLNLIDLIGYCVDGDQRLLVYEYIPSGSLGNHLFDIPTNKKPLDWATRMKIASGVAEGLEYLHEKANPPIIYRDLNSSNILLDEVNNPKLSDYGLTTLVLSGNKMHLSPTISSYGYCAPEYERYGELTLKSDVYSFGIVLLELITGRRALDTARPTDEQSLVTWAQPIFRKPKRFPDMADPLLNKEFPVMSLNQAVGVAAMCLTEEPSVRPEIGDVVAALSFLALAPPDAPIPPRLVPILSTRVETLSQNGNNSSIEQGTVSSHKNDNCFDIKVEDEEQKNHSNEQEDSGSSDFGYVDSSDSDHKGRNGNKYRNQNKSVKSRKWGSSSKHKSSRLSSWRSNESSSFGYSSRGYSLRCDSKEDIPSAQDIIHKSHECRVGSSGDEESLSDFGLKHRSRDGLPSINSTRSVDRDQDR